MAAKVIVVGTGGHAKVVADIVLASGDELVGFLDDHPTGKALFDRPVIGGTEQLAAYENDSSIQCVLAIGSAAVRRRLDECFHPRWYTAVHPSATIGRDTVIGEGTVIMAGAVISPCAIIGRHSIINTGAIVEHDNRLGDFVHLSPRATLCGTVTVGNGTHLGSGATVINNLSICADTVIGAGATVVRDITEGGVYVGVPAKRIK